MSVSIAMISPCKLNSLRVMLFSLEQNYGNSLIILGSSCKSVSLLFCIFCFWTTQMRKGFSRSSSCISAGLFLFLDHRDSKMFLLHFMLHMLQKLFVLLWASDKKYWTIFPCIFSSKWGIFVFSVSGPQGWEGCASCGCCYTAQTDRLRSPLTGPGSGHQRHRQKAQTDSATLRYSI